MKSNTFSDEEESLTELLEKENLSDAEKLVVDLYPMFKFVETIEELSKSNTLPGQRKTEK